jgi:hypothetical protein
VSPKKKEIKIEETSGSIPGRPEFEVFAPDGYNFQGPHSLIVRDTRIIARREGQNTPLVPCDKDCTCKEVPSEKKIAEWIEARVQHYARTRSPETLARMLVDLEGEPEFGIDEEWPE